MSDTEDDVCECEQCSENKKRYESIAEALTPKIKDLIADCTMLPSQPGTIRLDDVAIAAVMGAFASAIIAMAGVRACGDHDSYIRHINASLHLLGTAMEMHEQVWEEGNMVTSQRRH